MLLACLALTGVSLTLSSAVIAQEPSQRWKTRNDRGNRWEGRVEIPVGRPAIELLSFVGFREPYAGGEDLEVRFFLPQAADVVIRAREIEERVQYLMVVKDREWAAGEWNVFGSWPTGEVLAREGVPTGNLGVVVRLGAGEAATWVPALIYHSSPPETLSSYLLHFRPGSDLSEIVYRIYDGEEELSQARLVDLRAFVPFAIELETAGLPAGSLRLELRGELRGKPCGAENQSSCPGGSFLIYHQPL